MKRGIGLFIYNEGHLSSFLDHNRNSDDEQTNILLEEIRNTLFQDNEVLNIDNQVINTENDLKCILFHKLKQLELDLDYEIHSEEPDIISINYVYCNNLVEMNDIENEGTRTRKTDLTITINPIEGEEFYIRKGYSRFGTHIDLELKYIRKGFSAKHLKEIRKDLCKLKYLTDQAAEIEHHHDDQGHGNQASTFGISFIGFRKRSLLERYLHEGLEEKINIFNNLHNTGLILFYRENDIP